MGWAESRYLRRPEKECWISWSWSYGAIMSSMMWGMERNLGPLQDECTALTTDWFTSPTQTSLFVSSISKLMFQTHISHLFLVLSICKRLEKVSSSMPLLWARQGVVSEWNNRFYKNSRAAHTRCVWVSNYRRLCRMPISGWNWLGR